MKYLLPLILSILAFLLIGGAYAFLFFGVNGYVERIAVAVQSSETLTRRDTTARSIEKFLKEVEVERETLSGFVIKNDDVVSVIELLEQVARDEGVVLSISSVSASDVSGWDHHERIDVLFSVSGSFANLTDFIATLESLPVASRVESGGFEVSGNANWFGSFAVTFIKEKL